MTWVKICGTTNLEDALTVVDAGADAVGFVFHEKSPRNIGVEAARKIIGQLPRSVEKVGVFVGGTAEKIEQVAERVGLTAVQFYPESGFGAATNLGVWKEESKFKLILAVRADELVEHEDASGCRSAFFQLDPAWKNILHALLIDSGAQDRPGGTGEAFDWERCSMMVRGLSLIAPVIVAGGLTSSNVGKALKMFQPFGVDVASGVEEQPGKKDPEKVRAFVQMVKEMDKQAV